MPVIKVALPVPLPRLFDYLVPEGDVPVIGSRVSVPFGPRKMTGIVQGIAAQGELP